VWELNYNDWNKTLEDKRKYMRFDIPLIIRYKSVKKTAGYFGGLTRNFSYKGFSFDATNVNFEPKETLEFQLKIPQSRTFVSFLGDVVWKMRILNRFLAGVKFKEIDKKVKSNLLEKICDYGNVSFDMFVYDKKPIKNQKE
jgi:hypothetical protein